MPRTCGENGFEKVLLHPSKKKRRGSESGRCVAKWEKGLQKVEKRFILLCPYTLIFVVLVQIPGTL